MTANSWKVKSDNIRDADTENLLIYHKLSVRIICVDKVLSLLGYKQIDLFQSN